MPRCYTPPITPRSQRQESQLPCGQAEIHGVQQCRRVQHVESYNDTSPKLARADHPVPLLDIPWTESNLSAESTWTDYLEVNVTSQLREIQQLLRSNFGKVHTYNAQMLARLQVVDDSRISSSANTDRKSIRKSTSRTSYSDLPVIDETGIQQPLTAIQKPLTAPRDVTAHGSIISFATTSQRTVDGFSSRSTKVSHGSQSQVFSSQEVQPMSRPAAPAASSSTVFSIMSNTKDMERLFNVIERHSRLLHRQSTAAHRWWVFFENRSSSRYAYWYGSHFVPFFLVLSVLISFAQTVGDWRMSEDMASVIQSGFEIWFAAEITVRFIVCPRKSSFWCDVFNLIDLISVAPLLIRIYAWIVLKTCDNDVIHRAIGLVPMLRLLKMLRRFQKFQLLVSAFSIALEALPVLIFSLLLLAVMFSGLIFLVESRTLIPSLPSAFWLVIVTMTTVGYGDVVPETTMGKCIIAVLMICSALYMALPIGIVGNAFSEVWKDRDRLLLITVLRESFAISGISRNLVHEMFMEFLDGEDQSAISTSSDPEINVDQFQRMLRALQVDVSEDRAKALFEAIDCDRGGTITCDEFIQKLFPYAFLAVDRIPRPSMSLGALTARTSRIESNVSGTIASECPSP